MLLKSTDTQRQAVAIACPYYQQAFRNSIYCSPISSRANNTAICFNNTGERKDYMSDFCNCGCWRGCVIAQILMRDISISDYDTFFSSGILNWSNIKNT